jgi:hypothetical protein
MRRRNPDGLGNGQMASLHLQDALQLEASALELWERALGVRRLSPRGGQRVLRVARTIADLDAMPRVGTGHIAEALTYRSFDLLEAMAARLPPQEISGAAADGPDRAGSPPEEDGGGPLRGDCRRHG